MLQPTFAQVGREIVAGAFQHLLQIAFGNALDTRDARRREIGLVKPPLDRFADTAQQRALRICRGRAARGDLMRAQAREKHFREA